MPKNFLAPSGLDPLVENGSLEVPPVQSPPRSMVQGEVPALPWPQQAFMPREFSEGRGVQDTPPPTPPLDSHWPQRPEPCGPDPAHVFLLECSGQWTLEGPPESELVLMPPPPQLSVWEILGMTPGNESPGPLVGVTPMLEVVRPHPLMDAPYGQRVKKAIHARVTEVQLPEK